MGASALPAVRAGLSVATLDECERAARAALEAETAAHARAVARSNLPGLAELGL
ncbi:hypothetical protein GCM10009560_66170 [Nonomuraea longicatena]|uniref:Uncharacterized protein n=2 Tax=Nonomuraea longicatena TaxID=83682 RepID=A0ABP4BFH2_9ACTN